MAARRGGLLCLPLALVLLMGSSGVRAAAPLPAASSEAFDSVLGNTASCHRACQLTYSLHTYPKVRAGPRRRLGPARARPRSLLPPPGLCWGLAGSTASGSPSPVSSRPCAPAAPSPAFFLLVRRTDRA